MPELKTRLAAISTHPIQYHSPVFSELASRPDIELRVYYGWEGTANSIDHGFGKKVAWDIPLLTGYTWEMVPNVAHDPGAHHFAGIDLPDLNTRILRWGADAVLVYGWSYKAHLAAMKFFKGKIPVVFRGDSTRLDDSPGIRKLVRRLYLRHIYKNIDIALAVGTNNRRYYESLGLRPEQIVFAPHAVDNRRFEESSIEKSEAARRWRHQLGIEDQHIAVMFVGKLEHKKSPALLLEAFKRLNAEGLHLIFVGSGELESTLQLNASCNRVHFLGFQNQTAMEVVYRLADVVALPSRGPGETWGLALNEAMACGCALIASDKVGSAVDLIDEGVNGWIFPSGDEAALRLILAKYQALGRERIGTFGQASRTRIAEFTILKQVDGIVRGLHLSQK